jgi:hypothetical protein
MFEQELNEQIRRDSAEAAKSQSAELEASDGLFSHYEIRSWEYGPHLYKIIAASLIINIVGLLVMAQTDFTKRGCDSPFVGRVCQVLDTVYIGSVLFGTEREYADAVYEKSELEDADITFIDVSGETPPLTYPEGYFQIANPVQYALMKEQGANGFPPISSFPTYNPSTSGANQPRTTPKLPKPNPNPLEGDEPDSPFKFETDDDTAKNSGGKKTDRPLGGKVNGKNNGNGKTGGDDQAANNGGKEDPKKNAEAENEGVAVLDKNGVYINKRPIKDFGAATLDKIDKKEVSLETPFRIVIAGKLGLAKDKKTVKILDPKVVPDPSGRKNDPAIEQLAKDAVLATSDAGWFGYLYNQNVRNVVVSVEQTDTDIQINVQSDQPNEDDARRAASGLNGLIALSMLSSKPDDKEFLSRAELSSQGKTFQIKFNLPKPLAQEMIRRMLDDLRDDGTSLDPTARQNPNENTAVNK